MSMIFRPTVLRNLELASVLLNTKNPNAPSLERACSPSKWEIAGNVLLESPTRTSVIADIHSSGWVQILVKGPNKTKHRRQSFSIPKELATALIDDAGNSF